jgi:hypothetical protein
VLAVITSPKRRLRLMHDKMITEEFVIFVLASTIVHAVLMPT